MSDVDLLLGVIDEVNAFYEAGPGPDGLADANGIAEELRAAQARRAQLVEWYKTQVAEATEWHDREIERLTEQLRQYHRAVVADGGPVSLPLPCGVTLKRTSSRGKVVIDDPAEVTEWAATEWPDALVTETPEPVTKLLGKSDLRKLCTETDDGRLIAPTGEALPGVRIEGAGHNWTITTGDER